MHLPGSDAAPSAHAVQGRVARLGSAIHVEGLNHWYRSGRASVQALHRISLDVPAGGYVALTGPSGAGKSTLLSLIGGLERPQQGGLRVGEHNLTGLRGDALAAYRRGTVGFVFQHFGLLDLLSARENIELAAALASPAPDHRRLADLLERIHSERGCTLVVVTHNEAVAERAERRHRLDDGRLLS
ncbi:MAG: ATP-binding cassette domain-containing protein [Chloroflexi bacterium]|nr:MAG: ATP-binding cassette domain-containing protein [Chloroflexota bacterium]